MAGLLIGALSPREWRALGAGLLWWALTRLMRSWPRVRKLLKWAKKAEKGTGSKRAYLCWGAIAKRLGRFLGLLQRGPFAGFSQVDLGRYFAISSPYKPILSAFSVCFLVL